MIVNEVQNGLRFFLLQPDNASCELFVDVERLLACDRVAPHERVDMFHGLASHDTATAARSREVGLFDTGVHGLEGFQVGDKGRREPLEGGDLRSEERVTASAGLDSR